MASSFLFDVLRRIIPHKYRKHIPGWAKRGAIYAFQIEAHIFNFCAFFIKFFSIFTSLRAPNQDNATYRSSLYQRIIAMREFSKAKSRISDSDYFFAKAYLDRAILNAPNYAEAYYLRGRISFILSENEDALANLKTAIRLGHINGDAHFFLGMTYCNLGEVDEAISNYERALELIPNWAQAMINLAHLKLWVRAEDEAVILLREAIKLEPAFSMAHQNIAALYDRSSYKPSALDLECRREIMLYDAYNVAAEQKFNAGLGHEGIELWGKALMLQKQISMDFRLPDALMDRISRAANIDPKLPIRILPYEWVTQIGHMAMLDTYCKIQALGWRPAANLLLLAPLRKVVNHAYLDYWRSHFQVISDEDLVNELFPYQRFIGDSFNAFLHEDGLIESWPDVGAKAHIEWDRQLRKPLLRISAEDMVRGRATLRSLGIPDDAWFVCLHAREGGYHREISGSTQEHRNTSIKDYFAAICQITDKGGWVIRLGDPSMTPLPVMHNVIDYAHSPVKSDWMDVYLCGASRFFIGTTSGLTNAVISFGVPCLLVNCLSNFSQLWNKSVVFTLKLFWSESKNHYLKFGEIVNEPVRSKVFNLKSLAHSGIRPVNNSSDEILDGVIEMFERMDGKSTFVDNSNLMISWNQVMKNNIMFGNAQPALRYLAKHSELL